MTFAFPPIGSPRPRALQISALSEEQLRGLEEAFEMFDTKHEGTYLARITIRSI